jgi:glycosyltransferase involved in cell wall biosynthesis
MRSQVSREPLNVLVNAVSARSGGGATFLLEQLRALEKLGDVRLTIVTTRGAYSAMRRFCPRSEVIVWERRPLPVRIMHEQIGLPKRARDYDVVYMSGNFALARTPVPQVMVLQSAWHFGGDSRLVIRRCPRAMRARFAVERRAAHASVRNADQVICVSGTMKSYAVEDMGPLSKISVAPSGPPSFPASTPSPRTESYVLSVGTDMPHKDWSGLIGAFERGVDLPPLWLVGPCSADRRRELAARSRDGSVRFLGPVTDRRVLGEMYRGAACVIAHSHLESYGFTAVEALSLGSPLAASDIPAHREFCGSAAHFYDPCDPHALISAVKDAIDDGPPTDRAPALALSWDHNARLTRESLEKAACGSSAEADARAR